MRSSSAHEDTEDSSTAMADDGMAVLVQPMLRAAIGGVIFTADPVAGRRTACWSAPSPRLSR
ncbi:hypothetical protein HLK59_02810 [Streptomyces sp. S3(2020)]|uniref:PEP/pyruvate-binding domain-containing protein n=1 Tax=Streptomyces sp. S3(2020) TaxID=2732044 RepID=UPI001488EBFA|nr:PEP/pyruvate-binding domain-containing protein [Streptomyces sp. S3(2020)]NNN29299.1 hypothetical protein [Streptomyces sp. S3(2020)]